MSNISLHFAFSANRYYNGNFSVAVGKDFVQKREQNAASTPSAHDELTLSQKGQAAYETYKSQLDQILAASQAEQGNAVSRIFSTAPESADNLIQFLGLDTINANDTTLAGALNLALESESQDLAEQLNELIQQAGLDNETEEIILSEDAEGNIVVEGKIDEDKKKALEELINSDPKLVEQLKDYKAKQEIAYALENDLDISFTQSNNVLFSSKTKAIENGAKAESIPVSELHEKSNLKEQLDLRAKELLKQIHAVEALGSNLEPGSVLVAQNSKHLDTTAWAYGIDTANESRYSFSDYAQTEKGVQELRSQLQTNREKIDATITGLLDANNITLDKEETLNISVNQKGNIVVGEGVSADKREKIEQLLNDDETLGYDLLFTHTERELAVMGDSKWSRDNNYILTDLILRREYGVSLDDFQLNDNIDFGSWLPNHTIMPKDSNADTLMYGEHELLDSIFAEERALYENIEAALKDLKKNNGNFSVEYTYKNGITIEDGVTDQAALDKVTEMFTSLDGSECSVTLSPLGYVLNAQVNEVQALGGSILSLDDTTQNLRRHFEAAERAMDIPRNNSNCIPTRSRLQQYVFDAQRLFQFNTGADASTAKAMNVTFNTKGTEWWED